MVMMLKLRPPPRMAQNSCPGQYALFVVEPGPYAVTW